MCAVGLKADFGLLLSESKSAAKLTIVLEPAVRELDSTGNIFLGRIQPVNLSVDMR